MPSDRADRARARRRPQRLLPPRRGDVVRRASSGSFPPSGACSRRLGPPGSLVVHVADRHRPDVADQRVLGDPRAPARGGFDAEFFDGFEPVESEPVVEKRRYSAFFATDLALLLHEHGVETIVVAGVKTNVCIRATATDGLRPRVHRRGPARGDELQPSPPRGGVDRGHDPLHRPSRTARRGRGAAVTVVVVGYASVDRTVRRRPAAHAERDRARAVGRRRRRPPSRRHRPHGAGARRRVR